MAHLPQIINSDTMPAEKSPFNPRILGKTNIVQRVLVAHEDINGGQRYELECAKLTGTEKCIHVDPNKDREIYAAMLKLVPEIANLRENEQHNKYLVLAKQWEVEFCREPRAFRSGIKDVKVAKNIRQLPPKVGADLPNWLANEQALLDFCFETHCGQAWMDETLGLPRANWVSKAWALAMIKTAQGKLMKPTNEWDTFDKSKESPVTDLTDTLTTIADDQAKQDAKPAANAWVTDDNKRKKFFQSWNNIAKAYDLSIEGKDDTLNEVAAGKLHDYAGSDSDLLKNLKKYCEDHFTIPETETKPKADEKQKEAQEPSKFNDSTPVGPDGQSSPATRLPSEIPSSEPANVIPFIQPALALPRTITGISVLDIGKELNKHLPPQAYGAIKYGQMTGKTDIDGDAVRDRFDKVFGPLMWRIVPQQLAGRVEYSIEIRKSNKGVEQNWHICTLIAHQFQYAMIMPDGSFQWIDGMVTSDLHDNTDQQYCYRGAMTSLMKQFYKLMGGMNHIMYNEYTHIHAAKELEARKRSA